MNIFDEFAAIVRDFEADGVEYALVGGVAMAFHSEPRFTRDIDLLSFPDDIDTIRRILDGLGYFESSPPWTFRSTPLTLHRFLKVVGEEDMVIDILLAGNDEHGQIIRDAIVAKEDNGSYVRVARKADIIFLKRKRDSLQDRADIEKLEATDD